MMHTFTPHKLPLHGIRWERILPLIGKANLELGRYDELTKSLPSSLLSHLTEEEAITSSISAKEQYLKALRWAISHWKKKSISTRFICEIHARIKKGAYKGEVGKLRRWQNWIGPEGCTIDEAYFYPPKPEKVPACMKNLRAYFERPEKDSLVQIAIYFAQLLAIHPFMDGNGRVARVLIPVLLCKKQLLTKPYLFLSPFFSRNRGLYIQNLYLLKTHNDWETWITFFLQGIIEQSERSSKIVKGQLLRAGNRY